MDVALTRLHRNHLLHGHRFRRSFHVVAYPSHHGNCPAQSVQPLWGCFEILTQRRAEPCPEQLWPERRSMFLFGTEWNRLTAPALQCPLFSSLHLLSFVDLAQLHGFHDTVLTY